MQWDTQLEKIAQEWASSCRSSNGFLLSHNPNRSTKYSGYVGENIFGASNQANGEVAVQVWFDEISYYNYQSNTCASGRNCGHYTQVVWANSNKLGCARAYCSNLLLKHVIVCNYAPGGNIAGQRPYESKPNPSNPPSNPPPSNPEPSNPSTPPTPAPKPPEQTARPLTTNEKRLVLNKHNTLRFSTLVQVSN